MQTSSGFNLQNTDSGARAEENASYPLILGKNVSNMQLKEKADISGKHDILSASYLKHTAVGNPLLNDSINRSQLSGNIFVSALALSPPQSSAKKLKSSEVAASTAVVRKARVATADPAENPTINLKEKLNQRYQDECEETMMVVTEQQREEGTYRD